MASKDSETASLRVGILSAITLIVVSIGIYEGLKRIIGVINPSFTDSAFGWAPVVLGIIFIWLFYNDAINVYKKLFKEK